MIHIHKLNTSNTRFLEEHREDPITGEDLRVGDEIVFCASCQSAFLRDSWTYIGEQHCGQTETLPEIPVSQKLTIRSIWQLDKLIWKSNHIAHERSMGRWANVIMSTLLVGGILLSAYSAQFDPEYADADITPLLFFAGLIAMISIFFTTLGRTNTRKGKYSNIKRLSIFENGLLVDKKRSIKLSQVKRVSVRTVHNPSGNKNYYIYFMEIFLHDGTTLKFEPSVTDADLWEVDHAEIALFFGLAKFSFFVPVVFDIHRGAESSYLNTMIKNYDLGSNFQVNVR